jgi:thiol-disulfide isomerase/thioredoxin
MLRLLRIAAFSLIAVLAAPVAAGASIPFDAGAFSAAQAAGKTILIDVYAPWCPVCRKQQSTLETIQKEKPNLVIYRVDFDSAKNVLNRFRASKQGPLILFKGTQELGRLVYDADPANIRALVAKGF